MEIQGITVENYSEVAKIYKLGLATGVASFETNVPHWESWDKKYHSFCRHSAVIENKIVGWVALTPTSKRKVYAGVAEVSIYVDPAYAGKGIGRQLMTVLIPESEAEGIWTLQSGIFRENSASLALHQKFGFREIGYREKVAQRDGVWYDNVLMERRSRVVGLNL